ncbi:MAG TPA: type II toxin-antitoxin system RelE/ParE family toxin [Candidatus Nanoarchaeia archaeon]|nr:type II toxin-antitoxin system RelE/ParE family toxin [Candidatus Nanoarchaeia archaeon]
MVFDKKTVSAKENPFHFFERLEGRGDYKLRVGDYRVIADINQKERIIAVTLIGHRKNIYQKL